MIFKNITILKNKKIIDVIIIISIYNSFIYLILKWFKKNHL
jgi:phosphate starvation-inducible membrane PsiE